MFGAGDANGGGQAGPGPGDFAAFAGKPGAVGVIDLGDPDIETPELVAQRLRGALAHIGSDRLIAAPDCGMKYLLRQVAFGKLEALVAGAEIIRRELA